MTKTKLSDADPGVPMLKEVTETPIAMVRNEGIGMERIAAVQRAARAQLDKAQLGAGRRLTLWRLPKDGVMDYHPGIIVEPHFSGHEGIEAATLPEGRAAHLLMFGSWADLPAAWQTLFEWARKQGLTLSGINWEIYGDETAPEGKQQAALYALLA